MGLIRAIIIGALVGACGGAPADPLAWCGTQTQTTGEEVEDPRSSASFLLFLLDGGSGVFLEGRTEYVPAQSAEVFCPECFTWTQDAYELRWRSHDGGYELMSPAPDGGVSRWTCTSSREGRAWQDGGEWLDCDIASPDGSVRTIALSTNAWGKVDDPPELESYPCLYQWEYYPQEE